MGLNFGTGAGMGSRMAVGVAAEMEAKISSVCS
jgi:hypothetical protein